MIKLDDILALEEVFGSGVLETIDFRGEQTVVVEQKVLAEVLAYCFRQLEYNFLLDISSIDHLENREERFEIVYELTDADDQKHLRVRSAVAEGSLVQSVMDLWATADWHEREVYDMMGIEFAGHPNLKRILMWEGYPYFPLRKDFPLSGKPTELPEVAFTEVAPLEGGPFVASPGDGRVRGEPRSKGES